jgi:hypothetical protein
MALTWLKELLNGKRLLSEWKDAELEVDFEDLAKDFTVNGNDISLNIKYTPRCYNG